MSVAPVTLIAECCQNHNGDRAILKDMIWAAADAGATHVKMQTILSSELTHRERFEQGVIEDGVTRVIKRPYAPELERLRKLDLALEDHAWFIDECVRARVKPLTTVFTRARVDFLASLAWREIKLASYDCASLPLIREVAAKFDHLYISTGSTFDDEIRATARALGSHPFTFLHCVTIYPTPLDQLHLARIEWLRQFTPSVGFSDHTLVARDGVKAALGAIHAGATVIERHFTILPPDQTKDGPVSINPALLKRLAQFARASEADRTEQIRAEVPEYAAMWGQSQRELSAAELLNRDYYRGRFASKVGDRVIYNWEEVPLA